MTPIRPILRWHGGKWLLAPWVIQHFPPHRIYVEPYGGAASILLRKPPAYAEVYNDLDCSVVSLFKVMRDPEKAATLHTLLTLTPFSRVEFEQAYKASSDSIESARRLIIRSYMGFGSDGHNEARKTGFRACSNRSGTTPAHDWANYPAVLEAFTKRLQGVVIENRLALEVMTQHDSPETLHYCDPPYIHATRQPNPKSYIHEMSENDHKDLCAHLKTLSGMVVLSGYPHPLYDELLPDWQKVERESLADGARRRTEVLWINPCAARNLAGGIQIDLPLPKGGDATSDKL